LTALVETEQKYLSETKQSRSGILERTQLNSDDLGLLRANRDEKETKFFAARDKLKTELVTILSYLFSSSPKNGKMS
jgi:hypothetical protein